MSTPRNDGPLTRDDYSQLEYAARSVALSLMNLGMRVDSVRLSCVINVSSPFSGEDEEHEAIIEVTY